MATKQSFVQQATKNSRKPAVAMLKRPSAGNHALTSVIDQSERVLSKRTLKKHFEAEQAKATRIKLAADQAAEAKLADRLVTAVAKADDADVSRLSELYGLKRSDLVRLTGFSLRALAEWSAGKLPSEPARRRLNEVRRLLDALAGVVHTEAIPKWLHTRNDAFDRLTPLQAIELGEVDRLWQMVYDLGAGSPE